MASRKRRKDPIWSNEEHNLLFRFWKQHFDKIDLPGRTQDKAKRKIYEDMCIEFDRRGYRRNIQQLRKKIQNLKMEHSKYVNMEVISDDNIRNRVDKVSEILALVTNPDPVSEPEQRQQSTAVTIEQAIYDDPNSWQNNSTLNNDRASEINCDFMKEIVKVTEALNKAIVDNKYDIYEKLCDTNLTCFEPEAFGNLVEGLEFHKFYFDSNAFSVFSGELKVTIVNPKVHMIGNNAACIAYVRLIQGVNRKTGTPESLQSEETRLWRKTDDGQWKCFHFHRSQNFLKK